MLNSGKRWSAYGTTRMMVLSAEGKTARQIAHKFGRTTKAVACKRSRIRKHIAKSAFTALCQSMILWSGSLNASPAGQ